MAEANRTEPDPLQKAGNLTGEAGRNIVRDQSSGGTLGSVIRGLSDSRGAEPLWAAVRMGADELAQALKPLPDSIQAHAEPGGIFEPLYSDIVAGRDNVAAEQPLPSPSQIAKNGKATDTVHGPAQQAEKPHAMTPSGIANEGKADATAHGADRQGDRPHTPSPSEISKARGEKTWADRVNEERQKGNQDGNAGNAQNERGRERSLADEQREQDKGRSR